MNLLSLLALSGVAFGAIDRITKTTAEESAAATTSVVQTPTIVQYTTTVAGAAKVVSTEYKQSFVKTYEKPISDPPKGSIGLGTIKGSIGVVKPTRFITQ
uniref:ARAD1D30140p n=1 Tax=Blastobotrys adeninivorans TaxID=409370 RepID=A0A060TBT8_BLAAD